ncbi:alpha-amylase [Streptomyces sp. NPDC014793]|uniref:alpha-amylase n=1 Tax=Streptomyces sp. NPDC014793 TaxID=3364914 RepID=UPI0036FE1535
MRTRSEVGRRSHGGTAAAVCAASLTLPVLLAAPSEAAPRTAPAAPSCVAMYQSWRYTEAGNDCAGPANVLVVYEDGFAGLCSTVAPFTVRTVGEGYLGPHGRADHLEACEPS